MYAFGPAYAERTQFRVFEYGTSSGNWIPRVHQVPPEKWRVASDESRVINRQ